MTKKLKGLNLRLLVIESIKILSATFIASFFVYWEMKLLDGLIFDTTRTINVFYLLTTGALSFLILYSALSWMFEVKEIRIITDFIKKAKFYKKRVVEIYTDVE